MPNGSVKVELSKLVVASKLRKRAKDQGMSMSLLALDLLSTKVGEMLDRAVANAKEAGRKTVLERDLQPN